MGKPAARLGDSTAHGTPLGPGPGSMTVLIGNMPAWRGLPLAAVAGLATAKQTTTIAIKTAEAATLAAPEPVSKAALKVTEEALKVSTGISMGAMISGLSAGMSDISICPIPLPIPPHGPGLVTSGSMKVMINNMPACRMGDTITEALGPPNKIVMGCMTVQIG